MCRYTCVFLALYDAGKWGWGSAKALAHCHGRNLDSMIERVGAARLAGWLHRDLFPLGLLRTLTRRPSSCQSL